ncbi:MAG: V-type ATP synthase subunit D [Candidatus Omnitrophota bacterium]|nr:V-type ATP synthase subunit D [Candidatus Omnitrophota bacterium]
MAKVKLTKGELKKERDALRQYERYLPTLLLKKQQLQMEILHQINLLEEKKHLYAKKRELILNWGGLLGEAPQDLKTWITPDSVITATKNIAGVDLPVFSHVEFPHIEYDLFLMPLWLDSALDMLKALVILGEEISVMQRGMGILKQELRITTQRVNLFEKVKIPEATEAIRLIKIYIGDQMANAVGRAKIAKSKIEEAILEEVLV